MFLYERTADRTRVPCQHSYVIAAVALVAVGVALTV